MWKEIIKSLVRKRRPVHCVDLTRIHPVSGSFGKERGTPIDRYYIDDFLSGHRDLIRGHVLEIGDSYYSTRHGGDRVTAFEVLHATGENGKATIVGDLTDHRTLPEARIDCFICTQTFNFIYEVEKAVAGAHRLLKPGGTMLATVAGISQISRYDMDRWGDYWRFTTASALRLFSGVFAGTVEVKSYGNVAAATAFLQGVAVEDLPDLATLKVNDPNYQLVIAVKATK